MSTVHSLPHLEVCAFRLDQILPPPLHTRSIRNCDHNVGGALTLAYVGGEEQRQQQQPHERNNDLAEHRRDEEREKEQENGQENEHALEKEQRQRRQLGSGSDDADGKQPFVAPNLEMSSIASGTRASNRARVEGTPTVDLSPESSRDHTPIVGGRKGMYQKL